MMRMSDTNRMTTPLSAYLMQRHAVGMRHGLVLPPQRAPLSQSDVASIVHMGVPRSVVAPWQSAAGGVGRDEETARLAAIGEGIERAAAATVRLPLRSCGNIPAARRIDAEVFCLFTDEQRASDAFPFNGIYRRGVPYTEVFSLNDNSAVWVPQPLVALSDEYGTGVPTSSGLAAGPTATQALLRGIQELIERDALMVTWLHGLPGRRVRTAQRYSDELASLGGEIYTFDMTPRYSPFPVVAVAGGVQQRGKWRYSLGVACRESWAAAEEKAYLEWNQGVLFAGIYGKYTDTSGLDDPLRLKSFDEHAMYYTLHPEQWAGLRLFAAVGTVHHRPRRKTYVSDSEALQAVRTALQQHGIRMLYRDCTTVDAEQVGVRVIRTLSPDMAMIFAHQEWPFLARVASLLSSRYPWAKRSEFPYLMPHPLG